MSTTDDALDRGGAGLSRSDSDAFFQWSDEDLAIADGAVVSAAGPLQNRVNRDLNEVVIAGDV